MDMQARVDVGLSSLPSSALLARAFRERDEGRHASAEEAFRAGVRRFPHELDHYGHPVFRKELLRMLLACREWNRSLALISEPDFPTYDRWYDLLFARAYTEAGDLDAAKEWWNRTAANYPSTWAEIENWFSQMKAAAPEFQLFTLEEALLRDFEVARTFVRHGLQDTSGTVSRLFAKSASASKAKAAETLIKLIDTAQKKIQSNSVSETKKIPKISHRMWLTNPEAPREPSSIFVDRFIQNSKSAFDREWRHYFWVQDEAHLPSTLDKLRNANCGFEVKLIGKDLAQDECMAVVNRFIQERKFALASDVTRMKCLNEHGGMYLDLGVTFNARVDGLLSKFTYCFLLWHNMFFQSGMIAMPPRSALSNLFVNVVRQPDLIPRYIVGNDLNGGSDLSLVSGPLITTLFFLLFSNEVDACLCVANRSLVTVSAQQSWYSCNGTGEGKFGNALLSNTKPTLAAHSIWEGREDVFFGTI
ncbi:glycosyltransferase [Microvirga sp. 0TCS3.31]